MSYSPYLDDAISRVRFAVGDTAAAELLGDATYEAALEAAANDEAAATRQIAGHLAVRYAQEPDQIGSDGSSIRWSERVAQWRLIAQGSAVQVSVAVRSGGDIARIRAGGDWRCR